MSARRRIGSEFDAASFTHEGRTHEVFLAGAESGVVIVREVRGLHPGVVEFGRRLIDAGHTVYLPSLFGRPGQAPTTGAVVRSIVRVCVEPGHSTRAALDRVLAFLNNGYDRPDPSKSNSAHPPGR